MGWDEYTPRMHVKIAVYLLLLIPIEKYRFTLMGF